MTPPGRILIVRLSSLGDILHALPAFQSLRDSFPQARIDWLVERRMAFLLSVVEGIDDVIVLDTASLRSNAGSLAVWRQVLGCLKRLRSGRYDISLDFQGLLKTAFLSLLSGAHRRMGFSRSLVREWPAHWFYHRALPKPEGPMHVVALNELLAAQAGARPSTRPLRIAARAEDESAIAERIMSSGLCDYVVLNPGGGWPTKRWRPSRYGELAARIAGELGLAVVVTTGPGEESYFEEIAANCRGPRPHNFQVPFLQLIPLIKRARLIIGGDTGPFHLACALETPAVGILGPTDPARNGPWKPPDESIIRRLPCSFCNGRTCPTQNECMDIEVAQVFQAAVRRLAQTR